MMDERNEKIINAVINVTRKMFYTMYEQGYEKGYENGYSKGYDDGINANAGEALESACERGYMEAMEKIDALLERLRNE